MPTYEYACPKCGHEFEQFQSMRDAPLTKCPKCKKSGVKRLVGGGAGLIFKGSGFYITDYKNKSGVKTEAGESKKTDGDSKKTEGSDSKATPSKTDTKAAATASKPSESAKK